MQPTKASYDRETTREMFRDRSMLVVGIFLIVALVLIFALFFHLLFTYFGELARQGRPWAAGFLTVLAPASVWLASWLYMLNELRARSLRELAKEPGDAWRVAVVVVGAPVISVLVAFGNFIVWVDRHGR